MEWLFFLIGWPYEAFNHVYQRLETRYGVEVRYHAPQAYLSFPYFWRQPPTKVSFLPLRAELRQQALYPLREALSVYPKQMLKSHLQRVVLLEDLSFFDTLYGATYLSYAPYRDTIYLACADRQHAAYERRFILDSFHHELSSIFLRKRPFPENLWRAVNGPHFYYRYEKESNPGLAAIQQEQVKSESKSTGFAAGFLSDYSSVSLEEDLNVFAAFAMTRVAELAQLAHQYPRLGEKLRLWLAFYESIDTEFKNGLIARQYRKLGWTAHVLKPSDFTAYTFPS